MRIFPIHRFFLAAWVFVGGVLMPAQAESPEALAQQGNQLLQHGRIQEAIESYQRALELNPSSPLIQYNLGTALAEADRFEDAAKVLTQAAAQASPRQADAFYNLGVTAAQAAEAELGEALPELRSEATAGGERPSIDWSRLRRLVESPQARDLPPELIKSATTRLEQASHAFRQSVLAAPEDLEAIHNYEVARELSELFKQIEQQQQQQKQDQEQSEQDQQGDQEQEGEKGQQDPQQGERKQEQNQGEQQEGEQEPEDQSEEQSPQDQAQEQQGEDEQEGQEPAGQEGGLEKTPTPSPDSEQSPQAQDRQEQPPSERGQQGGAQGSAENAEAQEPISPEEMNALSLLNLLEEENPEQFKRLFQFRGRGQIEPREKNW